MQTAILNNAKMPYCPGCGHTVVTHSLAKALAKLDIDALDTVVVSDIGCCGLVDGVLSTHTVHGLHGRSTALALGIALGLDAPGKKVIVIQGDGGATIGLQHLLEAARQNVNMTLIVQNNMIYGMTGGQVSGLTPGAFKEMKMPALQSSPPFDVVSLAQTAGAAFSARAFVEEDITALLAEALQTPGFALLEIIEQCPSHGVRKVTELHDLADFPAVAFRQERPAVQLHRSEKPSLFDALPVLPPVFSAELEGRISVVIAGSAGEGIQLCGDLLAQSGALCGLHATQKGEYPVTVGSGFSAVEIILSRDEIHYTGIETPDVVIISSADGYQKVRGRVSDKTTVIMDAGFEPVPAKECHLREFRKIGGKKGAALLALAWWMAQDGRLSPAALKNAAEAHKHSQQLLATITAAGELS